MEQKIILIGYMGSGKTTLGKKLARELKIPFIDSDEEIERMAGKTIPLIFAEDGEAAFRKLELDFISTLAAKTSFVLSTGGGMPCFNDVMELLKKNGTTIYLKNSSEELAKRLIRAKSDRPLIRGKSSEELIEFIEENLLIREFYYKQAHVVLEPEDQTVLHLYKLLKSN